jgi:TatD DNase family protein
MRLIDTHCHLDFDAFNADREGVVERALKAGVEKIVAPSVDIENAQRIKRLAEDYPCVYAAVGVHPNSSLTWDKNSAEKIRELARDSKVVAIGEIGLDYYRDSAPKETQRTVLEAQLNLAAELDKPVIVHNRNAANDVIEILLEWQESLIAAGSDLASRPGVLHSFSGDLDSAAKAVAGNCMIGFTGPITFKNARGLNDVAAFVPLESILVETDSPFLAPHPLRGQRNEPANVRLVAEKIAAIKNIPLEQVASTTSENARRLFRFGGKS